MRRTLLTATICAALLGAALTATEQLPAYAGPVSAYAVTASAQSSTFSGPGAGAFRVAHLPEAAPVPPDATPVQKMLENMRDADTWGHPDLFGEFAGMQRWADHDYAGAMKYFLFAARYADKPSQMGIALMYQAGLGVAEDPVKACAWFTLAAERGYPTFVATRNHACNPLTPAQHTAVAAELATLRPVYGDAVAKLRMGHELLIARAQMTGSRVGFDAGVTSLKPGPEGDVDPNSSPQDINFYQDYWAPWRWDPQQYFALRDAQWTGAVTVGEMVKGPANRGAAPTATPSAAKPASATSSGGR